MPYLVIIETQTVDRILFLVASRPTAEEEQLLIDRALDYVDLDTECELSHTIELPDELDADLTDNRRAYLG